VDGLFEPIEFSGIENCAQVQNNISQSVPVRIDFLPRLTTSPSEIVSTTKTTPLA
jgi:hypothetical protein